MCGLVGMAGSILEIDKKALKYLMLLDVWRGEDSTGLGVVNKLTSEYLLYKSIGHPESLFMKYKDFDEKGIYKGAAGKVFIGHNRAATKGKIIDKNAHPFKHGNIIGAHNGTLISSHTLEKGYDFDVDSEAIFYNLSKYETKSVIKNIYGAYALTWYDNANDKLHIIRNKERPLFWCRRTDKDVIYWASEEWMLLLALKKANISHTKPESFDIDTLYTLDVNDVGIKFRDINFEIEKGVEGFKPKVTVTSNYKHSGGSSNVIPFVGGNHSNQSSNKKKTEDDYYQMKMMEGSEVLFRFSGVCKGVSGNNYLRAYPNNPNLDFDIRIYGESHPNWKDWCGKLHNTFKGRIKKVVRTSYKNVPELYFLIDLRTIEECEMKNKKESKDSIPFDYNEPQSAMKIENDDADLLEGYLGVYLTQEEWNKATKHGCANCGSDADIHDCDLVFIDHDDFLCGKCADSFPEFVKK